ncbi:MAG TPA: DUF397 domain-containing protein [Pseudonocardiaceae bacterium]|nr:DUF397 domain-containing protein [Pseudonocardiaceae bacterium]
MRSSDLSHAIWHKSNHTNDGGEAACVEVAELPGRVAIRDSKDPTGPALAFTHAQWRAFVRNICSDELA